MAMEWLSRKNLQLLIALAQGDMARLLSAVEQTFQEVYGHMDTLEEKITGVAYSPETETLFLSGTAGLHGSEGETAGFNCKGKEE